MYRCSWLEGYGHEDHRPDKTGILMETFKYGRLTLIMAVTDADKNVVEKVVNSVVTDSVAMMQLGSEDILLWANSSDLALAQEAVYAFLTGPIQMADGILNPHKESR